MRRGAQQAHAQEKNAPIGAGGELSNNLAAVRVPAKRAVVLAAGEQQRRLERGPRHGEHAFAVGVELPSRGDGVAEIPHLEERRRRGAREQRLDGGRTAPRFKSDAGVGRAAVRRAEQEGLQLRWCDCSIGAAV